MPRLSWNEIRIRAHGFVRTWKDAAYERGEAQSFYNELFQVFGIQRRSVARYEQHVAKLGSGSGYIDLFWPGTLIVEQKSAGRSLSRAYDQAGEYFDALAEHERPQYILVSDFQLFELHDLAERKVTAFTLAEFPEHVEAFGFMLGLQRRSFQDEDPANIKAAELVGKLYDSLAAAGYSGHDLAVFLVRIVFCLFGDDTGVFAQRGAFQELIEERTSEDGADLGTWLALLFQTLDEPIETRQAALDEELNRFPYVDGELFAGPLRIPSFDAKMRQLLLEACRFDWSAISPAIFGALFQSVMDPVLRRAQGAHYTSEQDILKVIGPLVMDGLRAEFDRLRDRRDTRRTVELERFQRKLRSLRFLDPACGCGNFLVIAYRELRLLELDVSRELLAARGMQGQRGIDIRWSLSIVDVDQFFGIEISEFPVRVAETALWMMDHIMNNLVSQEFGQSFVRIPLNASPNIVHGDALEQDWSEVLPAEECTVVLGNPPFAGAKLQSVKQRAQVHRIAALKGRKGTLDYVTAWFIKAGAYVQSGSARIGFVATSSIVQGQQVGQLWPLLFDRFELEICFAHQAFRWRSAARGAAHVHVVIVGLQKREVEKRGRARASRLLFSYPDIEGEPEASSHRAISPYLIGAGLLRNPHLTVVEARRPINSLPKLIIGSKPIDKGHYIFTPKQRRAFLELEPGAHGLLRPFVGAREFLSGQERWILALHDAAPQLLSRLPHVKKRMQAVRTFRLSSKAASTRKLAEVPRKYHINVIPTTPFLVIPKTSTEKRQYVPIGWLESPAIPSDALLVLQGASLIDFALLTSAMHMTWIRNVAGRLGSGYRYSIGIVYNTFPSPPDFSRSEAENLTLVSLAKSVLEARAAHPQAALEHLYDPESMPSSLRLAHRKLDRAVDRLYRSRSFDSDRERIEHLFILYEKMCTPPGVADPLFGQGK